MSCQHSAVVFHGQAVCQVCPNAQDMLELGELGKDNGLCMR